MALCGGCGGILIDNTGAYLVNLRVSEGIFVDFIAHFARKILRVF